MSVPIRIRRRGAAAIALLLASLLSPIAAGAQGLEPGLVIGYDYGRPLEIDRTWNTARWCDCDEEGMGGISDALFFGTRIALPSTFAEGSFGGWVDLSLGVAAGRVESGRVVGSPVIDPVAVGSYIFTVHSITLSAQIDAMAHYAWKLGFGAGVGIWAGYPLFTEYNYTDRVLRPASGDVGADVRRDGSSFGSYVPRYGVAVAPTYTYEINRSTSLVGMLTGRVDLSAAGYAPFRRWLSLGGSAALLFDLNPRPEPVAPAPAEPPQPVALNADTSRGDALRASIDLYSIDDDGSHRQESLLRIDTIAQLREMPLPEEVFFDRDSTELPARFVHGGARSAGFSYVSLATMSPVDIYRRCLDIIGLRMREHGSAKITLVGSAAGDEAASLALARSERVRRYLEESWGIERKRIALAVERTMNAGDDRDRCVRIRPSGDIAGPLNLVWKTRRFRQPVLDLQPEITAKNGVKGWQIVVRQGDREIGRYSDATRDLDLALNIPDDLADTLLPPIIVELTVTDSTGATTSARDSLPLRLPSIPPASGGVGISRRSTYLLIDQGTGNDRAGISASLRRIAASVGKRARVVVTAPASEWRERMSGEQVVGALRGLLKSPNITIAARTEAAVVVGYPEERLLADGVSIVVEE